MRGRFSIKMSQEEIVSGDDRVREPVDVEASERRKRCKNCLIVSSDSGIETVINDKHSIVLVMCIVCAVFAFLIGKTK